MGILSVYLNTFKKLKFYSKYIDYGFDGYIKTFQNIKQENDIKWDEDLYNLKKNLTPKSIKSIDRFLEIVTKVPLPSKDFLIKKDILFNNEELKAIKLENKFYHKCKKYYKEYNLQGFEKLEINVFKHHCGLKLLPKDELHKLNGTTFIDGGAFFGDSALVLNRYYNPKEVFCIEPNGVNFSNLVTTIKNNTLEKKIHSINVGLSNNVSHETLNYISNVQNHGASFIFKPKKNKTETVLLTTLDNIVAERGISNIGLIKLDVEGYGLKAIEGSKKTIAKYKPIISCAVYHNPEELFFIKPYLEAINPNYKFIVAPLLQQFILKELTLLAY